MNSISKSPFLIHRTCETTCRAARKGPKNKYITTHIILEMARKYHSRQGSGKRKTVKPRPYERGVVNAVKIDGYIKDIRHKGSHLELDFIPEFLEGRLSLLPRELDLIRGRTEDHPGYGQPGLIAQLYVIVSGRKIVRPKRRKQTLSKRSVFDPRVPSQAFPLESSWKIAPC